MTDTIDDAGPDFPSHGSMGEVAQQGMTLRDYFAGNALPYVIHAAGDDDDWARAAYRLADAFIKAREKK